MADRKIFIIEICLASVVLGIISINAAPRLVVAAQESKLARLSDNLYLIRCAIDMYKSENNGLLPGQTREYQSAMPGDFVRALTSPGMRDRQSYFQQLPANPFVPGPDNCNTVTCVNNRTAAPNGNEGTAWWFNYATGQFRACDSEFHTAY